MPKSYIEVAPAKLAEFEAGWKAALTSEISVEELAVYAQRLLGKGSPLHTLQQGVNIVFGWADGPLPEPARAALANPAGFFRQAAVKLGEMNSQEVDRRFAQNRSGMFAIPHGVHRPEILDLLEQAAGKVKPLDLPCT